MPRKTDYNKKYDKIAFNFCLLGYTDKKIAEAFGVVESTINLWKKKHPSFSESLRAGKDEADGHVVNALYSNACAGDTNAAQFWLKNRQGKNWRDKQEVDATVNLTPNLTMNIVKKDDQ